MSTLSLPSPYPFSNQVASNPSGLYTLFWDPTNIPASLMVINGRLDEDNFAGSFTIERDLTQRGSRVDGRSVFGTANLDYRYSWFADYTYSYGVDDDKDPYVYVPGGCISLHLKHGAAVLFFWTVFWQSDSNDDDHRTGLLFLVDDEYQDSQRRVVGIGTDGGGGIGNVKSYKKGRVWSGHCLVELGRGYHDAGLAILADNRVRQTRVHCVSMKAFIMRHPQSSAETDP